MDNPLPPSGRDKRNTYSKSKLMSILCYGVVNGYSYYISVAFLLGRRYGLVILRYFWAVLWLVILVGVAR